MGIADDHQALLEEWLERHEWYSGITQHYPTYRRRQVISPEQELRGLISQAEYLAEHYEVNAQALRDDARSADVHGEHGVAKALAKAAEDAQQQADKWRKTLQELERGEL